MFYGSRGSRLPYVCSGCKPAKNRECYVVWRLQDDETPYWMTPTGWREWWSAGVSRLRTPENKVRLSLVQGAGENRIALARSARFQALVMVKPSGLPVAGLLAFLTRRRECTSSAPIDDDGLSTARQAENAGRAVSHPGEPSSYAFSRLPRGRYRGAP